VTELSEDRARNMFERAEEDMINSAGHKVREYLGFCQRACMMAKLLVSHQTCDI